MIELRELTVELLQKITRCTNRYDLRIILADNRVFALEQTAVAFGLGIRWMHEGTILNPTTAWGRYCLVLSHSDLDNPLLLEYRRILIALEKTLPLREMANRQSLITKKE